MKKSKVLSTPTPLGDLSFDDFDEDEEISFKSERLSTRKWRQFKHQAA